MLRIEYGLCACIVAVLDLDGDDIKPNGKDAHHKGAEALCSDDVACPVIAHVHLHF